MYVTAVQPDTIDAPDLLVEQLAGIIVAQGHCDPETILRGQRVAAGSGQRLDAVLIQLGLVTERGLAQAYAELIGVPVAGPERYPAEPLFPGQLTARFLRHVRAMPIALDGGELSVAIVDPLNRFVPAAISVATGRSVRLEIAVPIELEAALDRLYPEGDAGDVLASDIGDGSGEPLGEDAERLK